jgi:hypothetical protein
MDERYSLDRHPPRPRLLKKLQRRDQAREEVSSPSLDASARSSCARRISGAVSVIASHLRRGSLLPNVPAYANPPCPSLLRLVPPPRGPLRQRILRSSPPSSWAYRDRSGFWLIKSGQTRAQHRAGDGSRPFPVIRPSASSRRGTRTGRCGKAPIAYLLQLCLVLLRQPARAEAVRLVEEGSGDLGLL